MAEPKDDLEAVRELVATLEAFSDEERARIVRWTCEKLGMSVLKGGPTTPGSEDQPKPLTPYGHGDIKSFIEVKKPRSDIQFAVCVAYFHQFEASVTERVESINAELLQEACRRARRARLSDPNKTLNNALRSGYLDKGSERGHYKINAVGENLIAMILPDGTEPLSSKKRLGSRIKKRAAQKKTPRTK